ncbi:unnamed protein product [Lathyrus oleraceus]|uniref:thaumatin-like protein 1b n=1 Tax=Pisum sativum TaxID=3888 RepID=UPI0021CE75EE|nr:thaumatin-like protein 1b [Pisum sativum]
MSSMMVQVFVSFIIFLTILVSKGNARPKPDPYAGGVSIIIINGGYDTIWPAVHTERGHRVVPSGVKLESEEQYELKIPDTWAGTIWARTGCSGNPHSSFHCAIGDCGTNNIHCHYSKPTPPVTQVKFDLVPKGGSSSYKVDFKDGFSVPVTLTPCESKCEKIMCITNLDDECPDWLAVYSNEGRKIGCKSPCYTTREPKDCCTGEYASPEMCALNEYTDLLDKKCPSVVSNAFDETHFTCFEGTSFYILFN